MSNPQPYIPFLKLKQNEIMALKELSSACKTSLLPFFDFPMGKDDTTTNFQNYARAKARQLKTHLGDNFPCYIDDYDAREFPIYSDHSYKVLLDEFSECSPIPVTGLDRTDEHKQAILDTVQSGGITSEHFAFRIQLEDIQSYAAVEDEIVESIEGLTDHFTGIDLIIDLRVSLNHDVAATTSAVETFINNFASNFSLNKVIVTGSSISSTITDICPPQSQRNLPRKEVAIFSGVKANYNLGPTLVFGDYTVVSPEYSDLTIEPELMRSVMASKLIYSHGDMHTIWRGTSLRMEGEKQYNEHASSLIASPFYRGQAYSWADGEFYRKSSLLSGFSAGSMVKHAVNAHVEFMIMTGI